MNSITFEIEEVEMAAAGLVQLPSEELPESFWEVDAPLIAQEDVIAAVRAERDED